jgi:diaminopimelate epimerase
MTFPAGSLQVSCTLEKWHGASNDFLFVHADELLSVLDVWHPSGSRVKELHHSRQNLQTAEMLMQRLAVAWCDRRRGLGADGLVVWGHDFSERLFARIWNSDGSRASTCGNALRCLGALILNRKLWDGLSPQSVHQLELQWQQVSATHEVFAELLASRSIDCSQFETRVSMGEVSEIVDLTQVMGRQMDLGIRNSLHDSFLELLLHATFVQLANPHLVLTLKAQSFHGLTAEHFSELGRFFQSDGVCRALNIPVSNIGFVEVLDEPQATTLQPLNAIVFERGAGLTSCCGSGGCAMRVALETAGRLPRGQAQDFAMPGGVIAVSRVDEQLELSGPAVRVCSMTLHGRDLGN